MSDSVRALQTVAKGLGELVHDVVFVGGAVAVLYMNSAAAAEPRPTDDVDCIIEVLSLNKYYQFEEKLRALGFVNEPGDKRVICRWNFGGTIVDVRL